jgi:hypothetical protein
MLHYSKVLSAPFDRLTAGKILHHGRGSLLQDRKPFLLTHNDEVPYTPARLKQVLITSPMRTPWTMIGSDGIPGFGVNKVHPGMTGFSPGFWSSP